MMMGEELSTDYEGRCGNCHSEMRPNDKYCRFCGTARGKGKFLPYRNEMYCVYGPPIKEVFKCSKCGHRWTTMSLGGDNAKYCPRCGTEKPQVVKRRIKRNWGVCSYGHVGSIARRLSAFYQKKK